MDDDAPRLFTGHLELIAATPSLARAAATSGAALAELLACEVPRGWPPEPMRGRQAEWASELEADPQLAGWRVWYIVQVRPPLLVGGIGFAGRPDADGVVECRFWLVPRFKRYGWAAEAMGGLIDWAFSHPEVRRIRAHAPRHETASLRVLEKNGLSHVGDGDEPGTLRFELARPDGA